MASYNKFNSTVNDLADGVHNLATGSLFVYLTNVAPVATNTVYGTPADLSTANGYTAGGAQATTSSSSQTSGLYTLTVGNVTWTATGAIGPFRYAVFYNNSAASKQLLGWWDYGSSVTLASGDTFTVSFSGGVLTFQ